ncbi:MAG: glycosyltransferase family 2 protein [Bacteroidota bacterium]
MNPSFSVIIPLYNKEDFIKSAVDSVLDQSFSDFEIIVVNDGSTDKSMEIVADFDDDRIRILNTQNNGAAVARNTGINNAKGKLMAFLDADDYWEKNHLNTLYKLHHTFTDAGLYCTGYYKVYSEKAKKKAVFNGISKDFFGIVPNYFEASLVDSLASASSVCIPAVVFNKIGLFDTSMRTGEDTDMWIRIALIYGVALHNTTTANYNVHIPNSLSKSMFEANKLKLVSKFITQEAINAPLKKYIDLNRYALALAYTLSGNTKLRKEALKTMNYRALNYKQRILIRMPGVVLRILKKWQHYMAVRNRFLSPFSR